MVSSVVEVKAGKVTKIWLSSAYYTPEALG